MNARSKLTFRPSLTLTKNSPDDGTRYVTITAPHELRERVWNILSDLDCNDYCSREGPNATQIELELIPGHDMQFVAAMAAAAIYWASHSSANLWQLLTMPMATHIANFETEIEFVDDLQFDHEVAAVFLEAIAIADCVKRLRQHTSFNGFSTSVAWSWYNEAAEATRRLKFTPGANPADLSTCEKATKTLFTAYEEVVRLQKQVEALRDLAQKLVDEFFPTATFDNLADSFQTTMDALAELAQKRTGIVFDDDTCIELLKKVRSLTPPAPPAPKK